MLNFYKKIDIDYYDVIVEKCLSHVKSIDRIYKREMPRASWYDLNIFTLKGVCPELELAFLKYDLRIIMAAAYVMYHPDHAVVHLDSYPSQARINIPLLNCKDTYTNFYKSETAPVKTVNPDSGIVSFTAYGDYTLVDRVEITQATVLRTKALHSVELPLSNPVPRITLTLGFNKDPVYLLD